MSLPVEVIERVIDIVTAASPSYGLASWDDDVLATLQACALVSRAWLLRCRHHLFRAVGVRCAPGDDYTIDALLALLRRHVSLGPYVRALAARSGPREVPKLHLVPMQLPAELPGLRHLQLRGGALYVPHQLALDALMRRFALVAELSLDSLAFYSPHDFRRAVSALPSLQRLVVSSPEWATAPPARSPAAQYRKSAIRLSLLSLSTTARWTADSRSVYLVNWLAHSGMAHDLEELDLRDMLVHDAPMLAAVEALLATAQPRLRELDLALGPDAGLAALSAPLLAAPALAHLALSLPHTHASFSALLGILGADTAPLLAQLSLCLVTYPAAPSPPHSALPPFPPFPTDDDWRALDAALQSDARKRLAKVVCGAFVRETLDAPLVLGWGDGAEDWLEEWGEEVRAGLPGMLARGAVHVWNARGEVVPVL